ncbi:hypothetical protein FD754_009251 [Muntiacus muntjak]|uniref:Anoctamin n=1 Tax=Muntiacus muntjak TaxID=9888 RepID=A0A5N3WWF7_MUNMU|nr:hypothetical protein FD754_009251 [Muntiacus muntjak]
MTVRGGWRKSLPIRNWRSTPEKDLALQLLLDSFLASFLVGNCPLPGHQQADLCGNEVLLESWGRLSQEGNYFFSFSRLPTPRYQPPCLYMASVVAQTVKESACNEGDPGSAPGLGRSPGEGHGNPLQYSDLENPMDRGAWQATIKGLQVYPDRAVFSAWNAACPPPTSPYLILCAGRFQGHRDQSHQPPASLPKGPRHLPPAHRPKGSTELCQPWKSDIRVGETQDFDSKVRLYCGSSKSKANSGVSSSSYKDTSPARVFSNPLHGSQPAQTLGDSEGQGILAGSRTWEQFTFPQPSPLPFSQLLYEEWASYGVFYKYQPIDLVRKYFGEKIGLYFAWLGVYTQMLIPASVVGIIVFLYGWATVDDNIPSMEMCDQRHNITMCPLCDKTCSYWKMSSACATARASHLFDNPATVFFSIFMALWAATFMEHWKRKQMRLNYRWDLTGFEEEEEAVKDHPRAEYEARVLEKSLRKESRNKEKRRHLPEEPTNKWRQRVKTAMAGVKLTDKVKLTWRDRFPAYFTNLVSIIFMIAVTFAIVLGVIIYRISTAAALAMNSSPSVRSNIRVTVTATAVIINLVVIILLDEVYGCIARWLTKIEVPKTEKSFEERLIFKAFLLKFVNSYTPIFYVAFFKGRFVGRPGDYVYIFRSFRMEECAPGGCLMELCIQLSIIMLGKQLIQNNLFEIGIPKMKKFIRYLRLKHQSPADHDEHVKKKQRYEVDYTLEPFAGLTPEYMEMIIQFGFVTLFVASFPLAPLFALLNNIIEIRLDAKKFVTELRRPVAVRAKDIGIWYNILRGVGKLAVIINAFVISFTSDFIPRLVYLYMYSETGTMHGFVNHTLSSFNVSDFQNGTAPSDPLDLGYEVQICRYKDYREPPWSEHKYDISKDFWAVLAARLAFVIVFQNLVMFMSDFVDWVIPDIPKDISQQIHKEKVLMVELFMREEQGKQQLLDTWMEKDRKKAEPCNNHSPAPAAPPPPPAGPDFPGGSL